MAVTSLPGGVDPASPSQSGYTAPPARGARHYLRQLFWLKWKLTVRGFLRSKSTAFGTILAILFLGPFSFGCGAGLGYFFFVESLRVAGPGLTFALLTIYVIWLLAPLLGFSVNDSYDVTRLFGFPVSLRRIFVGSILGSVLDISSLLLLPVLLAALVGFGRYGVFAALVALVTLALFMFQTIALSQAFVLASSGILRSRKFRDIAIMIVPVCYIGYQLLRFTVMKPMVAAASKFDWQAFYHGAVFQTMALLPPGLAARSIIAAAGGDCLPALGWLVVLGVVTTATVYISGWLVRKAYDGDDVSLIAPKEKAADVATTRPEAPESRTRSLAELRLPPVVAAIVDKELKYFTREPYFRLQLMYTGYMLVIGFVYFSNMSGKHSAHTDGPAFIGDLIAWGITSMVLFQLTTTGFNQFGTDGPAAQVFFSFPASRREMLIGKNIPLFGAMATAGIVIASFLCVLRHEIGLAIVLVPWMVFAVVILISVGNLASIYVPYKVVMRSFRSRQLATSGQGIAFTFLYLGIMLLSGILYLPIIACLAVPYYWIGSVWLLLSIPLAAAYVFGIYLLSLKLAEPALIARETNIIEKVYRTAE